MNLLRILSIRKFQLQRIAMQNYEYVVYRIVSGSFKK